MLPTISTSTVRHMPEVLKAKAMMAGMRIVMKVLVVPTPVLLTGENSALQLCETISHTGKRRVLIVTDQILMGLGLIDPIAARLRELGIEVAIYDEVKPDPTLSVVNAGLAALRKADSDAVLAVGGGSAIDAAKVIALAATNGGRPEKLVGMFKARKKPVALFTIPTTAGTGSEATAGAVISDDKTHQKGLVIDPKIVPIAAALDPLIMKGMPRSVTAETGLDALTHALESWMSVLATEESDGYASAAVQMILENLSTAYHDGSNLEARSAMALASHYGGLALNKASLGYVHAIAHQLGAYHGIPHGRANAIVLPHILTFNQMVSRKRLAELAYRTKLVGRSVPVEQAAKQMIEAINELIRSLNIDPFVPDLDPANFDAMIAAARKEAHGTYPVPAYMTPEQMRELLYSLRKAA